MKISDLSSARQASEFGLQLMEAKKEEGHPKKIRNYFQASSLFLDKALLPPEFANDYKGCAMRIVLDRYNVPGAPATAIARRNFRRGKVTEISELEQITYTYKHAEDFAWTWWQKFLFWIRRQPYYTYETDQRKLFIPNVYIAGERIVGIADAILYRHENGKKTAVRVDEYKSPNKSWMGFQKSYGKPKLVTPHVEWMVQNGVYLMSSIGKPTGLILATDAGSEMACEWMNTLEGDSIVAREMIDYNPDGMTFVLPIQAIENGIQMVVALKIKFVEMLNQGHALLTDEIKCANKDYNNVTKSVYPCSWGASERCPYYEYCYEGKEIPQETIDAIRSYHDNDSSDNAR